MRRALAGLAVGMLLLLATPSEAHAPYVWHPVPQETFVSLPSPEPTATPSPEPVFSKPSLSAPEPEAQVEPKSTPRPHRSAVKRYALSRVGAAQFACLDRLWTRESGWRWNAENRSSGAYGIPQALPGRKMASYGADWRTNPITQVKWGLHYIDSRYGSPCKAWAHSERTGWY